MVKILSLIGSLITAAGAVMFFAFTNTLMSGDASVQEFFTDASVRGDFGLVGIGQIVVYLGMILVFISGFVKTNKMFIVSGIFGILASLGCLGTFITTDPLNS